MYIVPPMEEEPPRDFVDFVAVHVADAQSEAARLVGPDHADEIYPAALSDLAARWRRLRLLRRLRGVPPSSAGDPALETLYRRLAMRAKQWGDDQIYDVDVHVVRMAQPAYAAGPASVALRRAAVLPDTARWQARPLAEAAIAWDHACRQAEWRRIGRTVAVVVLLFLALASILPAAPD
jgi:hypothetical protein